jgi:helix-turn-helix protein
MTFLKTAPNITDRKNPRRMKSIQKIMGLVVLHDLRIPSKTTNASITIPVEYKANSNQRTPTL